MQKASLTALAREQLKTAREASNGRSARTVFGGHEHVLRQTVIALAAGHRLDEHANPGEATVLVLTGRVRMASGDASGTEARGPADRAGRTTLPGGVEDSAVLLTVAKHR